jgi:hypothetical protein
VEAVLPIDDRQGLYTMRIGNHLNARGNEIVGNFVVAQLQTRFHLPLAGVVTPIVNAQRPPTKG